MCDPVWDLAGLSIEGHFDPSQDAAMLAGISATAHREAWGSRLHLYRIMLRLVAAAGAGCRSPRAMAAGRPPSWSIRWSP